jgi:hypothetical protein
MAAPALAFKDDGYTLFVAFVETFLGGVTFRGFQSGFGFRPDLILFEHPRSKTTLAVPVDTLGLSQEEARQMIQGKIAASERSFAKGA